MEGLSSGRHIVSWASGVSKRVFESIEVFEVVGGNKWKRCEAAHTVTNKKEEQESLVSRVVDLCSERVLSHVSAA